MRICIPHVPGRGAGLGNELIPWAKAFIASRELGADLLHPAWGLNRHGYRRYFGTSRFDWVLPRILRVIFPSYFFTEADYRLSGELDFGAAVRIFAERSGLAKKNTYALFVDGMWGGYQSIRGAMDFMQAVLHDTRYTQDNLYDLRKRLDNEKLQVAIHMRWGDFKSAASDIDYRGNFNTSLPLEWYVNICRSLRAELGDRVAFLLFTDGDESLLADFVAEFHPITTSKQKYTVCSDLLAMAAADLLVCSISSYSMCAAFLSGKPYLWFLPHLQQTDGFYSIWGHEPAQMLPDGLTAHNIAAIKFGKDTGMPRGHAIGLEGVLPGQLLRQLHDSLELKSACTDLIRYGVVSAVNV